LLIERFYRNHLQEEMDFAAALRNAQAWLRTLSAEKVKEYVEQCYEQSDSKDEALKPYLRHYRYLSERDPDLCPFAHPYYWAAFTCVGV
jgi:CHAT domain-containing protein